ncbi:lactate dehydrogenase [Candidatus Bathyarchaeota archaeon]|nr:lactate dehydrogenase [Candidatus Bathyarchaeota archaeon]
MKVVLGFKAPEDEVEILRRFLPKGIALRTLATGSEEELINLSMDAEALITHRASRKLIESSERLRLIQVPAAGVDGIDIDAAREKGNIYIANVGGLLSRAVAEHAFSLILALAKKTIELHGYLTSGNWKRIEPQVLYGKSLGIIGFGNIGREVGRLGRAFQMRILAVRRHPEVDYATDFMGGPEDIGFVMSESDFVVISVPLTKETRGLIGAKELMAMKPSAFIINVSRGPVMDQKALYRALKEGKIAGAGLDVFDPEPPDPRDPLLKLENVVMSPHVAGAWKATVAERMRISAENVRRLMEGKKPINLINLELGY